MAEGYFDHDLGCCSQRIERAHLVVRIEVVWVATGRLGWMYVYAILPGNGLVFGLLSCPVLEKIMNKGGNAGLRAMAGIGIQVLVLILNLAVCSQFDQVVGNLSG